MHNSARCQRQSLATERENTEKALDLFVTFYERFEAADRDLCDMDKRFGGEFDLVEILSKKAAEAQKETDQAMARLHRTRNGDRALAAAFDEAENDVNHGLRTLHQLVESTAGAAGALSCGIGGPYGE